MFRPEGERRPDLQSSQARVRAAEDAVKAARGERYPTAQITAESAITITALTITRARLLAR